MKKTAMMELIDELEEDCKDVTNTASLLLVSGFIRRIQNKLSTERQQIEDAYMGGYDVGYKRAWQDANGSDPLTNPAPSDYFTQTYEQK